MRTYNTRKRIRVTGGAGFLGSHLCERLLKDGHDVLCVHNFFTRLQRASSRTQLQRATTTVPATINTPDLPSAIDYFPKPAT